MWMGMKDGAGEGKPTVEYCYCDQRPVYDRREARTVRLVKEGSRQRDGIEWRRDRLGISRRRGLLVIGGHQGRLLIKGRRRRLVMGRRQGGDSGTGDENGYSFTCSSTGIACAEWMSV